MRHPSMKRFLFAFAALPLLAGIAVASQPMRLSDAVMDQMTAGASSAFSPPPCGPCTVFPLPDSIANINSYLAEHDAGATTFFSTRSPDFLAILGRLPGP